MKLCAAIGLAASLVGCASSPSAGAPKNKLILTHLSDEDMRALAAGTYASTTNAVVLTVRQEQFQSMRFYEALGERPLALKFGYMRNPGVTVVIVCSQAGHVMTIADRSAVLESAKDMGWSASTKLKVSQVYGPDGKTPMVKAGRGAYMAEGREKVTGVETTMHFPSAARAKEARRYIDPSDYECTILPAKGGGAWLIAKVRDVKPGLDWEEQQGFEPLAKEFGGSFEYTSTSSEEYVSR